MKSLQDYTKLINDFTDKRGWKNDEPNHLLTSLMIEIGELAENYQWQNKFNEFTEEEKRVIGYEFVDILFYLLKIASRSNIDIEKYFDEKLPKLEEKFPVGANSLEQRELYRKLNKNKLY